MESEKPVFLYGFGVVDIHFFRQIDLAGKRAPVQFAMEIIVLMHSPFIHALAADSDAVSCDQNVEFVLSYPWAHRFNNDLCRSLVYIHSQMSLFFGVLVEYICFRGLCFSRPTRHFLRIFI